MVQRRMAASPSAQTESVAGSQAAAASQSENATFTPPEGNFSVREFLGIDPAISHWGSPLAWRTPNGTQTNAPTPSRAASIPKALAAALERIGFLEGKLCGRGGEHRANQPGGFR